jgi:hypothetical protein
MLHNMEDKAGVSDPEEWIRSAESKYLNKNFIVSPIKRAT